MRCNICLGAILLNTNSTGPGINNSELTISYGQQARPVCSSQPNILICKSSWTWSWLRLRVPDIRAWAESGSWQPGVFWVLTTGSAIISETGPRICEGFCEISDFQDGKINLGLNIVIKIRCSLHSVQQSWAPSMNESVLLHLWYWMFYDFHFQKLTCYLTRY